MGTEFQFVKMSKLGDDRGGGWGLHDSVNVFNATELCTDTWLQWQLVYFTAIEKRAKLYSVFWVCLNQPMLGVTFRKVCTYPFLIHCSLGWGEGSEWGGGKSKLSSSSF